ELTKFRYDVILQVGNEIAPTQEVSWLDWQTQKLTLPDIHNLLVKTKPEIFALRSVSNARLQAENNILERLADSATNKVETVGNLLEELSKLHSNGIDPEDLWSLSHELPYSIHINWSNSSVDGYYDMVAYRNLTDEFKPAVFLFEETVGLKPWQEYANNPLQEKFIRKLVPQLRSFLKEKLPDYMVPSALVILEKLPLTSNGKVDRRALPAPESKRELEEGYVAPNTPTEEKLVAIWADILGLENI
ncbi:microcystin synthetase, partial [Candidatus Thiomargarita nelsonii]